MNDYTQEELSEQCNYDKTYLGKIERGDTNPSVEALLRVSNVLGVPVTKFFQDQVSAKPGTFDDQLQDPKNSIDRLLVDVLENTPGMTILTNVDGEILKFNGTAKKFLKSTHNNFVGESIQELPYWSQIGVKKETIEELIDLGSYGKKATRRISIRYKNQNFDLQAQVSFSLQEESDKQFLILQFVLIEETVDRTVAGDHFELLRR